MPLPALQSFEQCANWDKTVAPYIPELYELPNRLLDVFQSRLSITDLYVETNPLISGFAISVAFGAIFLVVAEFNKNYSQVDRCWSILPTFYIAHFDLWARLAGVPSQRIDAALFFSTVWSARLTYNYWRKGGYEIGSEDYRWEIIRAQVNVWLFRIFNATFISFTQSILLFAIAAPIYPVLLSTQFQPNLDAIDVFFVVTELGLVLTEWFADQQQWNFQNAKKEYQKTAKVPKAYELDEMNRGFITSGLWAYSRHPNFAAEQSVWLTLYNWAVVTTKTPLHWSLAGPVFLVLLFQGSTWLTELITAGKYPEYADYQKQVGRFLPKSLSPFEKSAPKAPKVIRTSELAKRQEQKEKQK